MKPRLPKRFLAFYRPQMAFAGISRASDHAPAPTISEHVRVRLKLFNNATYTDTTE